MKTTLVAILIITSATLAIMLILYQRSQPIIEQAQTIAQDPISALLGGLFKRR